MDGAPAPIKLVLELSPDPDSAAGWLHLDDGSARPFSGYLELMSLLEEIRSGASKPAHPRRPDQ